MISSAVIRRACCSLRAVASTRLAPHQRRAVSSSSSSSSSSAAATTRVLGRERRFLTQKQVDQYWADGFLVIPGFLSDAQCRELDAECARLVSEYNPQRDYTSVFSTTNQQANDYFLESGDKIRYFFEEGAVDDEGNVIVDTNRAFNKIGHGLHWKNALFAQYTFNDRVQGIAHDIGFVDPVVPQSMFIFKQPGIGGEVVPHQDSSFLYTAPFSCTGFWTPLEDCSLENGCLQAIPGSHKHGIDNNRRMIRSDNADNGIDFTAESASYDERDFVPLEISKGSLVLIHGEVVHMSTPNLSDHSRHAYVFHMVDGTAEWDRLNWLQIDGPFPNLNTFKM